MTDIMIDLETLGTEPGAAILTIDAAAQAFVRAASTAELDAAAAGHKATTDAMQADDDPRLTLLRGVYKRRKEALSR